MDNLLLIYASFGEGHKKAALSLHNFLDAPCVDLLDYAPFFVKRLYRYLYILVTERLTLIWRAVFFCNRFSAFRKGTERLQEFLFFPFFGYLRRVKPKAIIVTHFFPLSFVSALKKSLNIKLIAILTDTRAHPLWVNQDVDLYFVACQETEQDLIELGVPAHKIRSHYVAVREGFLTKMPLEHLRKKFSLNDKPCILCMSSLRGKFPLLKQLILNFSKEFNIFVIYGKNKRLQMYLNGLNCPSLRLFQFYEEIWEMFQLSDIIITKPGGMTVFEGVYMKKPFIFMNYIPGQEKENMDLLAKYGIGRFAETEQQLSEAIAYFKDQAEILNGKYPITVYDIRLPLKEALAQML